VILFLKWELHSSSYSKKNQGLSIAVSAEELTKRGFTIAT
jgi:hypothetical protein